MSSLSRSVRSDQGRPSQISEGPPSSCSPAAFSGRNVVIDCETTGLSPHGGDRMVSFAAIETFGGEPSGRFLYLVFNPDRKCHPAAQRVHGLADHLLSFQPSFAEHAQDVQDFVGDAPLVGHNVWFDIGFLSAEFARCGIPCIGNPHVCTMQAFRRRFPGIRASLDAACTVLKVDIGARAAHHGAWVDASLALAVFQVVVLDQKSYSRMEMLTPTNFVEPKSARRRQPSGRAFQRH